MNGAAQVFFMGVAYGQLLAGGSGGGDEPRHPWRPPSAHEADAVPAAARKPPSRKGGDDAGEGPYQCPVCDKRFKTEKAVHGHMRSHPNRSWRGMEEPDPAAEEAKKHYRYTCERCSAAFETRQALGGHRASHNGKRGCFWLSTQKKPVLGFDLNDPQPEQDK